MSKKALSSALEAISSEKLKDRTDGAERLRAYLSYNANVQAVPPKQWEDILRRIADYANTEHSAYCRKETAPLLRRVNDATSLFRWVLERGYSCLERKAVKHSLSHIKGLLIKQRAINRAVSLDYFKALKTILSHRPHLEHLDAVQWLDAVTLSFAAVLDEPPRLLKDSLKDENDEESMTLSPDSQDVLNLPMNTPLDRRKAPSSSAQEMIEILSVLAHLFSSPNANLLVIRNPAAYLSRMIRVFGLMEQISPASESTAHFPLLQALNALLSQIGVNDYTSMIKASPRIWPYLLKLWPSKSSATKEHVITALKRLSPYVLSGKQRSASSLDCVSSLWKIILVEPEGRIRLEDLNLANLTLFHPGQVSPLKKQDDLCSVRCLSRASAGFSVNQLMSWITLELGADCLKSMMLSRDDIQLFSPTQTRESPRSAKRQKMTDPFTLLCTTIHEASQTDSVSVLFLIQIFYMFLAKHFTILSEHLRTSAFQTCATLLGHDTQEVKSWALITLGLLATLDVPKQTVSSSSSSSPSKDKGEKKSSWSQVWTFALRNLPNKSLARAAAFCSNVLLRESLVKLRKDLDLDSALLLSQILGFAKDLQSQSPVFPSDSVCDFMSTLLLLSRQHLSLHNAGTEEKMCNWLCYSQWSHVGRRSSAAKMDHFDLGKYTKLCFELVDPSLSTLGGELLLYGMLPLCELANCGTDMLETGPIFDFMAEAVLISAVSNPDAVPPADSLLQHNSVPLTSQKVIFSIMNMLHRQLEPLAGPSDSYYPWIPLSFDRLKRILEWCTAFLLFYTLGFSMQGRSSQSMLSDCLAVFTEACKSLHLSKWSIVEQFELLEPVSLLFVPQQVSYRQRNMYPGLIGPCDSSRVPFEVEEKVSNALHRAKRIAISLPVVVKALWEVPAIAHLLSSSGILSKQLHSIIAREIHFDYDGQPNENGDSRTTQSRKDTQTPGAASTEDSEDDWGSTKDAGVSQLRRKEGVKNGTYSNRANVEETVAINAMVADAELVTVALRGLLTGCIATSSAFGSALVDVFDAVDTKRYLCVLEGVASLCYQETYLKVADLDSILQASGDLLSQYEYSKTPRLLIAILDLLEATYSIWIRPRSTMSINSEAGALSSHVASLCSWLTRLSINKKLEAWRVRLKFISFVESYLRADNHCTSWGALDDHPIFDNDESSRVLPPWLIQNMIADEDVRVAFKTVGSAGYLMDTIERVSGNVEEVLKDITSSLSTDLEDQQRMMLRVLCLGNLMISSAFIRRAPYETLVSLSIDSKIYDSHIVSILNGVAFRLGVSSIAVFHKTFVNFVATACLKRGAEYSQISDCILGYSTRRERYEDVVLELGTLYLSSTDREHSRALKILCNTVATTENKVIQQCLPNVAARLMVQIVQQADLSQAADLDRHLSRAWTIVLDFARKAFDLATEGVTQDIMAPMIDQLTYNLCLALWCEDVSRSGSIPDSIAFVQSFNTNTIQQGAAVYRQLVGTINEDRKIQRTENTCDNPVYVLFAMDWINLKYNLWRNETLLYFVTQRLLSTVKCCPFVDLQIRYLSCLMALVAMGADSLSSQAWQRLQLHGLSCLYADHGSLRETIWPAISILLRIYVDSCKSIEWTPIATISSFCLRIGNAAKESKNTDHFQGLRRYLLDYFIASGNKDLRQQGFETWLLLDPQADTASFDMYDLLGIMKNCSVPDHQFSLVTALFNLVAVEKDLEDHLKQEISTIVWPLLANLKSGSVLSPRECYDLASILLLVNTTIEPPRLLKPAEGKADLATSYLSVPARPQEFANADINAQIIASLAQLLESSDLFVAIASFTALQRIFDTQDAAELVRDDKQLKGALNAKDIALIRRSPYKSPMQTGPRLKDATLEQLKHSEWIDTVKSYDRWICALSRLCLLVLAQYTPLYTHLVAEPILRNHGFLALVLPTLILSLLKTSPSNKVFISKHVNLILQSNSAHPHVVRSIINVLLYLRNFPQSEAAGALSGDRWLDIQWLLVARKATKYDEPLTGLLALELACEYGEFPRNDQPLMVQDCFFDVYESLDEPDGFYGLISNDPIRGLVRKYHHEQKLGQAFELDGSIHEAQLSSTRSNMAQSLANFGFSTLALHFNKGNLQSAHDDDLSYDLAWKTDSWDLPMPLQSTETTSRQWLYTLLKSVHQSRTPDLQRESVDSALQQVTIQLAANVNIENPSVPKGELYRLLAIKECRDWVTKLPQSDLEKVSSWEHINSLSDLSDNLPFRAAELILQTRLSLVRSIRKREEAVQLTDHPTGSLLNLLRIEIKINLTLSRIARSAGENQTALNACMKAEKLCVLADEERPSALRSGLQEEFAKVYWNKGEHSIALASLEDLLPRNTEGNKTSLARAELYSLMGIWTAEARLLSASVILAKYFEPAIDAIPTDASGADLGLIHHRLASFADTQLSLLTAQAPAFDKLQQGTERRNAQLKDLQRRYKNGVDGNERYTQTIQESSRALEQDKEKISVFRREYSHFLKMALVEQINVLCLSDAYDDTIFRVISLLFANSTSEETVQLISKSFKQIASFKFLFLAPQITARATMPVGQTSQMFSKLITALCQQMCEEHPFHVVYQLFALRRSSILPAHHVANRRTSAGENNLTPAQSRAQAAERISARAKEKNARYAKVSSDIDLVCAAYCEWADFDLSTIPPWASEDNADEKSKKKKRRPPRNAGRSPVEVPLFLKIRKLRDIPVPVSTYAVKIDRTARYEDVGPTIVQYNNTFITSGGIHVPKIHACIGSDGKSYRQLFKGEDDTRQDAVMEQVFSLVNQLLSADPETKRRNLSLRTYKIIPLAPNLGLLEFVVDTKPVSDLLNSLLAECRPNDWPYPKCRAALAEVPLTSENGGPSPRIAAFENVLQHNKPVLRYYFHRAHKQPSKWFEQRLNYSRSVAAVSMVGYALGIGDRHTSNLLFDLTKGELIPIDFGIAFDAGSRLPIPERVPFRLTQNLVDGLGLTGPEGVFKRCCQEILRVLRLRSSVIMTILEVFRYDPLQKWDMTPAKIQRVQSSQQKHGRALRGMGSSSTDVNSEEEELPALAVQALAGVAEKLSTALSIEYKVNELIGDATDPGRLATIFPGWQPYI